MMQRDDDGYESVTVESVNAFVDEYMMRARLALENRWRQWPMDLTTPGPSEVTVGLLRRQYSFAMHMAQSAVLWSPEVGAVLLRCMVEVHIWLAWILLDVEARSALFIDDGLGKEKLILKHRADEIEMLGIAPENDPISVASKQWIEDQRLAFLIDINLSGSWSGIDVRKMAEEAGCRDFYRFTYPAFSTAVHSTWNHLSRFDLERCTSPLHAFHRIPRMGFAAPHSSIFGMSAKYLDKTLRLVDDRFSFDISSESDFAPMFDGSWAPNWEIGSD